MKKYSIVMASIVALVFAAGSFAEPEGGAPAPKPEQDAAPYHDRPSGLPEDELRDMVSTIMMVRISRSLELSDEQTVVMVKHMQEMRDSLSKLYEERDTAMDALRALAEKENATDGEINTQLQALMSIDEKRVQAKRDAFEKISSGFTTKQKAKLYITLQDFEGQLRRMMARAKEMGEDAVREKFQHWERGDGPRDPMDRPMVRQFMKDRRPGPETQEGEAPKAPEEKKAE